MKFDIPDNIKKKTNCDKEFMCLKEGTQNNLCKINYCLDNQYCLLEKSNFGNCINRFSFGSSEICKCPIRIEIFKKYGI